MVGIPHSYGSDFCAFLVPLVTSFATKIAMIEKARPAIIKTIMEDAPIGNQLINEEFLMIQGNEKMTTVNG